MIRVPFEIVPNTCSDHTVYLNNDVDQKTEVENYEDCRIRLETKNLDIGRNYYIKLSEQLGYRDADGWLFTYGITKGNMTLAISFPEPNENYIIRQSINQKEIREDDLEGYHIHVNNDQGEIILRVLDHNYLYIYFPVAWIWDIPGDMNDYEAAADCVTWDGLGWDDIFGQKII